MLANFLGKSKPVNFVVLFVLFLIYFSFSLVSKELSLVLLKELFWFLVVFSVYNFIIAKNQLTFDNSFAFLFFVILIGFFPNIIVVNTTFFACLTVLLFLRKVYSLQSSKNTFHKLFDGGLWLGISFLIEPYTAVFAVLFYTSIYLHKRFTFQTLLIPVIGFSSPVFLFFTYCFWYDQTEVFYKLFNWELAFNTQHYANTTYLFPIIFTSIFTVTAVLLKTPKALAVLNTFRRNWILTLMHLITATIILIAFNKKSGSEFLFIFFPVSIILANGIELFQKKWIADVIIILFLSCSIIANFI